MAGQDIKRAYDIQRLFEKKLNKVNHKKDHKARMSEAATIMDRCLGPEWRGEIQLPGIEIVEVEVVGAGKPAKDTDSFFDRLHQSMRDEGMDFENDAPEHDAVEHEKRDGAGKVDTLLERMRPLLKDFLKSK